MPPALLPPDIRTLTRTWSRYDEIKKIATGNGAAQHDEKDLSPEAAAEKREERLRQANAHKVCACALRCVRRRRCCGDGSGAGRWTCGGAAVAVAVRGGGRVAARRRWTCGGAAAVVDGRLCKHPLTRAQPLT